MTTFNNSVLVAQNALVTLVTGFTNPNDELIAVTAGRTQSTCGIASGDLPAVWVRRGRLTNRVELASDIFEDVRQYQLLCYVAELNGNEDNDEAAYDSASNWIQSFHKYLATNRQQLAAAGARIRVAEVRDSGDVSVFTKNSKRYAGVAFTVPVAFLTRF